MFPTSRFRLSILPHRRGVSAHLSSLMMLLQRSPVLPLLPQARVISTSGFGEVLKWTVTAITGLGAFDSVTGASAVTQILPTLQSSTVNMVAGDPLFFLFQLTGESYIPAEFEVVGTLPPGLVQTGTLGSTTDSITGAAQAAGTFPITITAWEIPGGSGFFAQSSFTLNVTLPPVPTITAQPGGGNFSPQPTPPQLRSPSMSAIPLCCGNPRGSRRRMRRTPAFPARQPIRITTA